MKRVVFLGVVVALAYFVFQASPVQADTSHCGQIMADETWSGTDNVHRIDCNVTVNFGTTLTITEGAIVKLTLGSNLIVNGTLIVQGTALDPVYFTSIRDDTIGGDTNGDGGATLPGGGNWRTIQFNSTSDNTSLIDYAIIRYGGYIPSCCASSLGAVFLNNASPTIQNTDLTDNVFCSISSHLQSFPTLSNNSYSNNHANGLCLYGGTISIDSTWDITDTSYFARGDITIGTGSTLTVTSDVVVKMGSERSLFVNGALRLLGTQANPVYVTSYRDDIVGGDTNGDGGATLPGGGNWRTIQFNSTSGNTSLIDHAVIRYGGYVPSCCASSLGAVFLNNASPTIQNTNLNNNVFCSISANLASFPVLTNNTYANNWANGLCLYGGTISSDSTWDITDTSYFVRGDITIGTGSTLTVTSDVVVKMGSERSLIVNGALHLLGTQTNPVYVTSFRDDTVGGDTNGDGGATLPGGGNWRKIQFNSTSGTTSLIDHAIIRYGGYVPSCCASSLGAVFLNNASPTIQNTNLNNNVFCSISANLASFPVLTNNTYANNWANGLCLYGGTISSDSTWDITDTSYFARGDITIGTGSTLTVTSDVVVKMGSERSLFVNGALHLLGTQNNPVYITSYRDDIVGGDTNGDGGATLPGGGNWRTIQFNSTSGNTSLIDHAVIRYGGYVPSCCVSSLGAVFLNNASPTIQNTDLNNNVFCSISSHLQSFPTLSNNSYTNNHANGLCLYGGTISIDSTWDITDTSYFARGDIIIGTGSTLTMTSDIVVKMGDNRIMTVNGALRVLGTQTNPVYITSYRDDSVGGDTNGDGGASLPAPDNWTRIQFNDTSNDATSLIDYAVIRYGGQNSTTDFGAIHLINASPTIQNSQIIENAFAGIRANTSTPALNCNNIYDNNPYGIYNATQDITITAENHWWGDPSGPYNAVTNPAGVGNDVTNGVDFIPWATAPCGPLQADFTAVPTSGSAPLEVTFSNASTGVYTNSLWDFGDGAMSTEEHPTHTYVTTGTYTVTLTVSQLNEESTITRTNFITVHEPVQADFMVDSTEGIVPLTVIFTNLSTGDFDSCLWDFGDGNMANGCNNPSHTYTSSGEYTVSLTVSGPGGTSTATKQDFITVYQPPHAVFTADTTDGQVPLTVIFTNSSTGDYDSCSWNFGDGGTSNVCGNVTHTYTAEGTFTVVLSINGPGGSSTETKEAYIIVEPSKSIYLPLALK